MHRRLAVIAIALLWNFPCLAQSNVNSASTAAGSPALTGYRVAGVRYEPICEVGSPPYSFRILRGEYWTDAAGQPVAWGWKDSKRRPPGEKHHEFTRVILGGVSFSLPMSPLAAGFVGTVTILTLGYIPLAYAARRRASDEPNQPQNLCTTKSD